MKIAIATDNNTVAQHFGHCREYTLADIDDGALRNTVVIENPGHEPGFLPGYLASQGISCIIAGGMGGRAQALFSENNIKTIVGISGPVGEVINRYLAGNLKSGVSMCDHECV